MGLVREQCAEWKKVPLLYSCNQAWMRMLDRFHRMLFLSAKHSRSLVWWEKIKKDALENLSFKNQLSHLVHWLGITLSLRKTVKNPSLWKESLTWIVPRVRSVRGREFGRGYNGCIHWGVGEDGRIGNLRKKTQCKGSNISQRKWKIHVPSRRWTNKILWRGIRNWEHPPWYGIIQFEEKIKEIFLENQKGLHLHHLKTHFRSISGNFIYRHHVEPRVKLYSPREESFPIPLKNIDVSRTTHINLDAVRESRIDDYRNIDGSRDLFDSSILLQVKNLQEYTCWSWERLTKRQATSRPDHYDQNSGEECQRTLSWGRSINGQLKNPKLENARSLRGIYFIDPEDKEFKEIIKNCREKIGNTHGSSYALQDLQEKQAWGRSEPRLMISSLSLHVSWKPMNPQECEWKNLYRNIMRTISQEKGKIHYSTTIWFTSLFLCLKLWKFRQQKQRWTMGQIGENFGVELDKSQQ